jgi:hypothetical protein
LALFAWCLGLALAHTQQSLGVCILEAAGGLSRRGVQDAKKDFLCHFTILQQHDAAADGLEHAECGAGVPGL